MTHPMDTMMRRLSPHSAEDIDDLAIPLDPRYSGAGRSFFPDDAMPVREGVAFRNAAASFIGFHIMSKRDDIAVVAMKLGSLSIEQDTEIVILTDQDYSGLERFGFRCERIAGDTDDARATCEEQIRRFWGLELVL